MRPLTVRSRHGDATGTAIIEFVWLAVLVLMPLLYIVLAVFEVQRSAYAASAAARSASRAYLTAPSQAGGYDRALAAVRLVFADHGIDDPVTLTISCHPVPGRCLAPGAAVTAEVSTWARLPLVPDVFGGQPPAVAVEAQHTSPYGSFRAERP